MTILYPYYSDLIIPPIEEPVTVDEFTDYCRIDSVDAQLSVIQSCITSARIQAENVLARYLLPQTWDMHYNAVTYESLCVSRPRVGTREVGTPPVVEKAIDVYLKDEDMGCTLADTNLWWYEESFIPKIHLDRSYTVWPTNYGVLVRVVSGWATVAEVPTSIKQWILLKAAELYENREASGIKRIESHGFVDGLLDPYRLRRL